MGGPQVERELLELQEVRPKGGLVLHQHAGAQTVEQGMERLKLLLEQPCRRTRITVLAARLPGTYARSERRRPRTTPIARSAAKPAMK